MQPTIKSNEPKHCHTKHVPESKQQNQLRTRSNDIPDVDQEQKAQRPVRVSLFNKELSKELKH